jgi:hypothetical protein
MAYGHNNRPSPEKIELDSSAAAPLKPSTFKHWYSVAALGLLNGILLLLLLNLVLYPIMLTKRPIVSTPMELYGRDKIMKAYPGWQEEDVKTLVTDTKRAPEYEPFTGFRDRPFRGKFVNVDPAGFRFSKDQAPWPPHPGATNVFVFGGSTTFGVGLPDDETIPSYLQECAPANHSSGHPAVYNFGRLSYFSSQELILFLQLLNAGFVPQVAVFIDGYNEFASADGQPRYADRIRSFMDGQAYSSPLNHVPMIWAAHWLGHHWAKPQPKTATDYADRGVLEGVADRWLANKRMIEIIANGFGVRSIFVWQPVPTYKYDLRYHFVLHSDKGYIGLWPRGQYGYALMEDLRAQGKLGPDVLWLADIQQDKRQNLYVDAIHYNAAFSKEIAGQICGFLSESPTRPPRR